MTPAELQALLAPHGIRALKSRSQHFLLDERVTEAMADAAGVGSGSRVLEIGPGPGVLTKALLDRGAEVVAVELDARFSALLRERFPSPAFTLVESDVLALPSRDLAARFPSARGADAPYALVSNLPYAITSATLQKFLFEEPLPATITLMIQKEVADRILAKPGDMSALAVMVRTLARVRRVRDVSAGAFLPPPKVASSVIHMELLSAGERAGFFGSVRPEAYFDLVRTAFAGKRKQVKNTLKGLAGGEERLEYALRQAKIQPTARPEELDVTDWIRLATALLK
jgi:16S rRNA (adenine1518-N6/adenine1519-N6)-dimethyltransferase